MLYTSTKTIQMTSESHHTYVYKDGSVKRNVLAVGTSEDGNKCMTTIVSLDYVKGLSLFFYHEMWSPDVFVKRKSLAVSMLRCLRQRKLYLLGPKK